jgi:1-deoxy-D-xylulose-5-phosphate reductoisomerase
VRAGKSVGLANKECLVVAGELITSEARRQGKPLLPIDSEHNAIHQCLRGGRMARSDGSNNHGNNNDSNKDERVNEVERIWLTASGGPFLHLPQSEFASITVQQALNHPTWKMGKRITIDSATLMNKGFEVIEACRLFDVPPERVQVVVHPQSTIHSMVEFVDGSILAQISVTDMRLPILYALTYPERIRSDLRFSMSDLRHLDFCPPDMSKFPCLALAYEALAYDAAGAGGAELGGTKLGGASLGGTKTIALNAADEVAVAAFLDEEIGFEDIPRIIEDVMAATPAQHLESIQKVLVLDNEARLLAREIVKARRRKQPPIRAIS